jgi:hypothetical protein
MWAIALSASPALARTTSARRVSAHRTSERDNPAAAFMRMDKDVNPIAYAANGASAHSRSRAMPMAHLAAELVMDVHRPSS